MISLCLLLALQIGAALSDCLRKSSLGDLLLVNYTLQYTNGTVIQESKPHTPYYPVFLNDTFVLQKKRYVNSMMVVESLLQVCQGDTAHIYVPENDTYNLQPFIFNEFISIKSDLDLYVTINQITTSIEHEIFNGFNEKNNSKILECVNKNTGTNAWDANGQTPLMTAIITNNLPIVSILLNAHPPVDVNAMKPTGFNAIFYAVQYSHANILEHLLDKAGVNPSPIILQDGSKGNTPLHYACLFSKVDHIESLLRHGANPMALNEYGQSPLELIPKDNVQSTKLYVLKLFENAVANHERVEL